MGEYLYHGREPRQQELRRIYGGLVHLPTMRTPQVGLVHLLLAILANVLQTVVQREREVQLCHVPVPCSAWQWTIFFAYINFTVVLPDILQLCCLFCC